MTINPISFRLPAFDLSTEEGRQTAHRYVASGIVDLNQAIASLKSQLNAKVITTITATSTGGGGIAPAPPSPITGLGGINDQTGATAYTTTTSDNGVFLIFNDASPVAVTLASSVSTPFFFFATNGGAGVVTLTPTSGLINGAGSWGMQRGGLYFVGFDGTNWKTSDILILAQTIAHATHEWLDSYDAATGLFTASQPAFSDISGVAATTQIGTGSPSAGKYVDGAAGAWTTLPGATVFVDNETVTITAGSGTLAHTPSPASSLQLYAWNTGFGATLLIQGADYTLSTATITLGGSAPPTVGAYYAFYRR